MCGIVGYIGYREAYPILIKGLQRLEYRGYDSAGIALLNDNKLIVYKTRGKVSDLIHSVEDKDISGTIGIAHTRWATHGEPNNVNAHPHCSQSEELAIVHNGIIENYAVLKQGLIEHGYTFSSETDTEVLVQLIEYVKRKNHVDLPTAVQLALNQIVGAYAIAVIEKGHPDIIVAARKGSPLVVGVGDNEYFLASDATPIIEFTHKVVYVGEEEIVVLQRGNELKIKTIGNVEKTPEIKELEMTLSQLEKGGYPHFMLKEIFEQPKTLSGQHGGTYQLGRKQHQLSGFIDHKDKFLNAKRIIINCLWELLACRINRNVTPLKNLPEFR
jgi:glucosamine--fructose-6-phosphate aminotransferase (isomerizing)